MSRPSDRGGPLGDLLVVDLSRVLSGPLATMLLGDLGARVIKVERPGAGDDTRSWGPPFVGEGEQTQSTYFLSVNRNKESIELDFADADDVALLRRMLARADVVVENFRPGVLARLGLDHDQLLELNPRLVVVSITGFGHDGPDAMRSGYDQIVQGEAGVMSMTGPDPETPVKVGVPAGRWAVRGAGYGMWTGRWVTPWMNSLRSGTGSPVICMAGSFMRISPNNARSCAFATPLPRQKCTPPPPNPT